MPVTTLSDADTWGEFRYEFDLPIGATEISLKLQVLVDDGAEIFLNDRLIGQAEIQSGPETLWVEDPDLFQPGTNVLRFYLVNHPVNGGGFGDAMERFGPGDCMMLEFSGVVDFLP